MEDVAPSNAGSAVPGRQRLGTPLRRVDFNDNGSIAAERKRCAGTAAPAFGFIAKLDHAAPPSRGSLGVTHEEADSCYREGATFVRSGIAHCRHYGSPLARAHQRHRLGQWLLDYDSEISARTAPAEGRARVVVSILPFHTARRTRLQALYIRFQSGHLAKRLTHVEVRQSDLGPDRPSV